MSVLFFIEHSNGKIKNAIRQAATYAADLAAKMGTTANGVVLGTADASAVSELGNFGIAKIFHASNNALDKFSSTAYAAAIQSVAKASGATVVVLSQTYDGKAIAPRLSVKLDTALLSGVMDLADPNNGFQVRRLTNSGKGIETIRTPKGGAVITVKPNSYKALEKGGSASVEAFDFTPSSNDLQAVGKEVHKASSKISITEADTVVSGGRGFKGPENWGLLLDFADALGAGTACSKPVADMDWRPHHEHVGQTGIQISPNLYIAIGISGAIQHLAGVNASKNIVVINKDAEAPFFKIADYGIVGDLFEVLPKLTEAVKKAKAQ